MNQKNCDHYAPIYNFFMKKDRSASEQMYTLIRRTVKQKSVLELATGTGLIAKNIAEYAKSIEATDYSEKMIAEARKGNQPKNLHFSVADACDLQFADASFDVAIISNALHIMPSPEQALSEINRVLKSDGVCIAPTFVHGKMRFSKRLLSKGMGIVGFQTEHKWTENEYLAFLNRNGWKVRNHTLLNASFPLAYTECIKM